MTNELRLGARCTRLLSPGAEEAKKAKAVEARLSRAETMGVIGPVGYWAPTRERQPDKRFSGSTPLDFHHGAEDGKR